jgi:serine/threonine protein kinase
VSRGPYTIGSEQSGWKVTALAQDGIAPRYTVTKGGNTGSLTYYPLAGPRGLAHQNLGARLKRWDKIKHECVVLVEGGRAQDGFYVIVPGLERIHRLGDPPLPAESAIEALTAAAKALGAFHGANIAHGELDAWSIVKRQDGTTALLGPGLRMPPPGVDKLGLEVDPGYAAPEILDLQPPTVTSDMFSLGLVLFRFMSGKRPVQAKDPSGAFSERGKLAAPNLTAAAPNAPAPLKALYAKLTAKDPAQRPQTSQELLSDLAAVAKGKSPQPNLVKVPELEPDRIGSGAIVLVVAALLAAFLYHYTTNVLTVKDPFAGFAFPLEGEGYSIAPGGAGSSDDAPVDSSSDAGSGTAPVETQDKTGDGGQDGSVSPVDSKTDK